MKLYRLKKPVEEMRKYECVCGRYDFEPSPNAYDKTKMIHCYECDAHNNAKQSVLSNLEEIDIEKLAKYLSLRILDSFDGDIEIDWAYLSYHISNYLEGSK